MLNWLSRLFSGNYKYIHQLVKMKRGEMLSDNFLIALANINSLYGQEIDFLEEYIRQEKKNSATFLFGLIKNADQTAIENKNQRNEKDKLNSFKRNTTTSL